VVVVIPNALADPQTYALPVFVVFMALEIVALRVLADAEPNRYRGVEFRDSRTSILAGVGSLVVTGAARIFALIGYVALYALTPLRLDAHRWYTWVLVLLLVDLTWYAYHRASHRVRLMWAAHQAHHNSVYFNLTTAVRQKWNPWFELLFWVPLPLLGVPPWMIFTTFSINLIFQFFDKNYGGILIVWDRLFGSYAQETHRPTYGLTKNVDTFNPVRLQYYEYAAIARDVRGAPGWKPQREPVPELVD
jgi:sterol desaturase/sphingolipid hydroxylase (fatty acid hydroxylase superfamily)